MGKTKERPKVQHFTIDVPPYRKQIFVCTGFTSYKQLRKAQSKRAEKWYLEWLDTHKENLELQFNGKWTGSVFFNTEHGVAVFTLRGYHDCWDYWECLIHELSHYLDFLGDQVGIAKETEARAYLMEFLFRRIRRKLQGLDKPT